MIFLWATSRPPDLVRTASQWGTGDARAAVRVGCVPISVRPRTIVWRGARRRCGRCGAKGVFRSYFELHERCPRCGYRFERDEAAFTGVWLLNYSFTIVPLLVLLGYMVYLLANGREVPVGWFLAASAVIVVIVRLPCRSRRLRRLWWRGR